MLRAIFILPFNATVTIPVLLLWLTRPLERAGPASVQFWFALVFLSVGIALFITTVSLFVKFGQGTLAPWKPPQNFVVRGPYRYIRHPMITGVILVLLGEALLSRSWMLAAWTGLFFVANSFYLPLKEEPDLIRRFGDAYRDYIRNVPRWRPRLTPWKPADS